jgi:hypothetical protein
MVDMMGGAGKGKRIERLMTRPGGAGFRNDVLVSNLENGKGIQGCQFDLETGSLAQLATGFLYSFVMWVQYESFSNYLDLDKDAPRGGLCSRGVFEWWPAKTC